MEKREHARRVCFEAVRSRLDEDIEDGASLTIHRIKAHHRVRREYRAPRTKTLAPSAKSYAILRQWL